MSVETKTAELFPSVLRGRAAWFWIMVVPLSLLTVVDALECWWMWGELAGPVGMRWIPDGWTVALRGPFVAVT
ncbi:MAG: hypothetical protein LBW77_01640, partial [Verrucomicrobiota bacterium]|nr:hypothetical protein [Verrucomicrobiota bacterium]